MEPRNCFVFKTTGLTQVFPLKVFSVGGSSTELGSVVTSVVFRSLSPLVFPFLTLAPAGSTDQGLCGAPLGRVVWWHLVIGWSACVLAERAQSSYEVPAAGGLVPAEFPHFTEVPTS